MRIRIAMILVVAATALFAAGFFGASNAQRREFSHKTAEHARIACATCHKVPTGNWVSARGFPDVADYPGHASCYNCHRVTEVATCAGCHVRVIPGPRGAARFPFPVKTRSHEFRTKFPHNIHQDLIALNVAPAHSAPREVVFIGAGFSPAHRGPFATSAVDDKQDLDFYNCAVCHRTETTIPRFIARTYVREKPLADAVPDVFADPIQASFFKDSPEGHASCFNCHYQNVKPIRTDCKGCHERVDAYRDRPAVERYSVKFDHQVKQHLISSDETKDASGKVTKPAVYRECASCHIRITQYADVKFMEEKGADVPISTCFTCHSNDAAKPDSEGARDARALIEELAKREETVKANQPAFQCVYCHTSEIGRRAIPPSHIKK